MSYIKSHLDFIKTSFAKINESQLSGINRDELIALLSAAEEMEDWDKVKELTALLKNQNDEFTRKHIFLQDELGPLQESVAQAKILLLDLANSEIKKQEKEIENKLSGLSGEDRDTAKSEIHKIIQDTYLNHPDYLEIRDNLAKKNPSWVGPFVKFRFIQDASMETLSQLARLLIDFKDNLDQLPKTLEEYANIPKGARTPGWEQLGDEFSKMAELRKGNWIVKALPTKAVSTTAHAAAGLSPVNLREEYRIAPKEKQKELLIAAAALSNLNKPTLIKAVTQNLSGQPSIDAVITFINRQVENANSDIGKTLELAWSAWPSVAVLYEGEKHLVFSFRNDSKLPELCPGASGWCIQPAWYNPGFADRFWSYAKGSIQLGILDFSVSGDSPFRTIGVTISPNRSVNTLCDQPNRCINPNKPFESVLSSFTTNSGSHSYPKELIDAVSLNFDQEVKLKTATDELYEKIKSYSTGTRNKSEALGKTLIGMIRNLGELTSSSSLDANDFSSSGTDSIAKQVVATEIERLRDSPEMDKVRDEYVAKAKLGLGAPSDVKIFELVMQGSPKFSEQLLNTIIYRNNMVSQVLNKNIANITPSQRQSQGFKKIELLKVGVDNATTQLEAILQKIKNK